MGKNTRFKKILYPILLILFFADLSYSFLQFYYQPMDGDISWNVMPYKDIETVLNNPLGIKAIHEDTTYANPNRFFCHWAFKEYMLNTPLYLQNIVKPIDSIYLASAIFKTILHLSFIILLSGLINGSFSFLKFDFIGTLVIISPLFQTNGFVRTMGVIDPSITYSFFYAMPTLFLIIYFFPIINYYRRNKEIKIGVIKYILFYIPLALVVCLSGPLNPGIILVSSTIIFFQGMLKTYKRERKLKDNILMTFKQIPNKIWLLYKSHCSTLFIFSFSRNI